MPRTLRWAVPLLAIFVVALGYAGEKAKMKLLRGMRDVPALIDEAPPTMNIVGGGSTATPLPAGWWSQARPAAVGVYTGLSSFYDFQTNGGSLREIEIDTTRPGHIHAVFTTCEDSNSSTWPARRVSYARSTDNGATWGNQQEVPAGSRAGFPSLDLIRTGVGTGYPVVASHFGEPIADMLLVDVSGPPTPIDLPDPDQPGIGSIIWPNITCAWDGSITMQASFNATDNSPQNYINRLDPTLSAWGGTDTFPNVFGGGARSAVASASDGRVGVICKDDSLGATYLMESTNHGVTWPANPIEVYPAARVVGPETLQAWRDYDLMYTPTDRYMAFSVSTTEGLFKWWRIQFYSTATGFVDAVPNDTLLWVTATSQTRQGPTGLPSIGISGSKILIAFVGYLASNPSDPVSGGMEGDIFLIQSTDAGASWSQPANITNTPTVDETFPSMSRWNESGYANLIWQEDELGGSALDGSPATSRAKQVFAKIDVTNLFPADDITTLGVSSPPAGTGVLEGGSLAPQGSFRNTGLAGQTSVPVRLEVLNSTPSVVFTSNKTIATMPSAATVTVTFDSIPNNLATGLYTVRAMALLPGDLRPTNDTAYSTINVFPTIVVSAPPSGSRHVYHSAWDTPTPEGLSGGWYTASSGANDWVLGTPGKPQLSHAHSGPNSWVTKLTGNYTSNAESYLASPSFDMSALSGNISVEFFHNFHIEANWDHATLIYSVDGGLTWLVADSALGSGPTFNTSISTGWYNEDIDSNEFSTPYQYGPLSWSGGAGTVGQLGSTAYAGHNDGWIRSTTVLPLGGLSDVRFRLNFFSDASAVGEGWAIDDFSFGPTAGSASVGIAANWNMISNPVQVSNDSVKVLYPTSSFPYGFSFGASGYTQDYTMENGTGYWAKFPGSTTAIVSGAPVFTYDVPVANSWNMIGSVSGIVDTADILDEPAGIQVGTYFGYSGGYFTAAEITPGQAVWAKMNAPGHLYYSVADGPIPPSVSAKPVTVDAFAGLHKLQITDNAGNGTTLYFGSLDNVSRFELPPVPPSGAFDARFTSGHMVQTTKKQGAGNIDLPIAIQSIAYPVTVRWEIAAGSEYMLSTGASSSIMRGTGSTTIRNSSVNRVVVSGAGEEALPTSYSLFQNYPNPFNPSTNVKFALPLQSRVNVEIYNVLGQRVRTLVNDEFVAGYHVVEWNGKNDAGQQLSSGVYMLKIAATNADGRSFSDVRKLMMVK